MGTTGTTESEQERLRAVINAARALDRAIWNASGYWLEEAGLDLGMLFAEEMVALREALENLNGNEEAESG